MTETSESTLAPVVSEVVADADPKVGANLAIAAWAKVMIENGFEVVVSATTDDEDNKYLKGVAY